MSPEQYVEYLEYELAVANEAHDYEKAEDIAAELASMK